MAQMKEQNKTPEKELNKMEIVSLLDAEFKTLVIRMLRKLIEYSRNIREEIKVTVSEIKIHREPTVKVGKLGFKATIWKTRKKETFNQDRMKKQEFKKKPAYKTTL